eukprot:3660085-Pleurochrysis_carterae.AAC.1
MLSPSGKAEMPELPAIMSDMSSEFKLQKQQATVSEMSSREQASSSLAMHSQYAKISPSCSHASCQTCEYRDAIYLHFAAPDVSA